MDYLQKKSIRSVAAAIAGFLRHCVRKIGITREKLPSCIALAVCPLVTFYLFELYTHNPFTTMHFKTQILNMAFYVLTALLLFGIVKYVRAALMLQTAFFMAAGLANYYVLNFRSAPIMPWDIYSIGTAASVAGNFNYTLKGSTVLVIIGFLILLLIESRFHMKAPARVAKRAALILLSIVLIYGYTGMIQSESFVRSFGLYDKLFTEPNMNAIPEGSDYKDYLNPESVVVRKGCKLEESLKDAKPGEKFQFVRTGFFTPDSKNPGVYNRVVTLRDSFKPAK